MVKEVSAKDKSTFNKAATHPLQSWEWGAFREKTGNKVVRLGEYKNGKLVKPIQLTIHPIPKTPYKVASYLRGPEPDLEILNALSDYAKKHNFIFTKMEPFIATSKQAKITTKKQIDLLSKSGATKGKTLFTPTSFWIDLTKSEDELLKSFHPKTRYNIRVASRHGVTVKEDNSNKAFEKYLELTRETVVRQRFYAHSEKYHRLMWQTLHTDMIKAKDKPIARILTATYKKEIITTWVVFVWHDFLFYPYGASTHKHKKVMANNSLMWEAIRYGKSLGLKTFDLWGREPGKGFTPFKEGYNPEVVEFLGTWDLVSSPLYWPYRTADYARWRLLRMKSKFTSPRF